MISLNKEQIQQIEQEYGMPIYIFNKEEFVENYQELKLTFQRIYQDYQICYSYKTNYTPTICRLVKELGGIAEVVSDMEYQLAKTIGYSADHIVYNGPYKGEMLEEHLLNGGINNIDRIEEAERIAFFADKHREMQIRTGIRVNFDIDAGYTSRFGIDIAQLDTIINFLREHHVVINGLHCHMSRARTLEAWTNRARTMINLVKKFALFELDYISLGSGMYGHMDRELAMQFPDTPTYKEYGDAVMKEFADYYQDKHHKPTVYTEPGTTLISKYVDFLAKIVGIKEIRGKIFVLCNCSFHNLGETCQMKNLPIRVFHCGKGKEINVKNATFVGYTCLEQDVLYRGYTGDLAIGDYIEFGNVGGYSLVDKPPFIQPNCGMIEINKSGSKLIKRTETFDDIFHTFF